MINWKLRLQNKVTLTALAVGVIALIYQTLGLCGVAPAISESSVISLVGEVINLLVLIGVVVDPTTEGVNDSERALGYDEPYKEEKE